MTGATRGVIYAARVLLRAAPYRASIALGYGWKIGFTTDLRGRARGLLCVCRDVEFVAVAPGVLRDELSIHRALRPHALAFGADGRGVDGRAREWYPDAPDVVAAIDALPAVWRGSIRLRADERGGRDTFVASILRVAAVQSLAEAAS